MAGEKFIALEETSQEIKASVDNVKTNVDGLKNTDVPAIDTLVDEVLKRIGLTGDTGGSEITGSIMSKLNEIIKTNIGTLEKVIVPSMGKSLFATTDSRSINSYGTTLITFTPRYDGVLAIRASYSPGNTNYRAYIKVNDKTILASPLDGEAITTNQIGYFPVVHGQTYNIVAQNSDSTSKYKGSLYFFELCGEAISKNSICNEF